MVVLAIGVDALEPGGARAQGMETLEAVLHRALHRSARETAQAAHERHARVLHARHVDDGRTRGGRGHRYLGKVPGAAQVRVRAVGAPLGVPPARGLHAGKDAAGYRAQRTHARVGGAAFALLDAVDATLAEPLALGNFGETVTAQVHLRVAPVAHDDAVALDVPKIRIRLAADVAHVLFRRAPEDGALALGSSLRARHLKCLLRRLDSSHSPRLDGVVVGEDIVHLVVVDGDEFGDDVLALATRGCPAVALARAELPLEIVELLSSQAMSVLVPHVLLQRAKILERATVAVRAWHRALIPGRDGTRHPPDVLLAHLVQLALRPAHLLSLARLDEVELLHLTLPLLLVLLLDGIVSRGRLRIAVSRSAVAVLAGGIAVGRGGVGVGRGGVAVGVRSVAVGHGGVAVSVEGLDVAVDVAVGVAVGVQLHGFGFRLGLSVFRRRARRLGLGLCLAVGVALLGLLHDPGVGLVVQRRVSARGVDGGDARLPPRPVVGPEHVDVAAHQGEGARLLGGEESRNLGNLEGGWFGDVRPVRVSARLGGISLDRVGGAVIVGLAVGLDRLRAIAARLGGGAVGGGLRRGLALGGGHCRRLHLGGRDRPVIVRIGGRRGGPRRASRHRLPCLLKESAHLPRCVGAGARAEWARCKTWRDGSRGKAEW